MPDRRTLSQHVEKLAALLDRLAETYRAMLKTHEQRAVAVREASMDKLRRMGEEERQLVQLAADIERERLAAAAALTLLLDPNAKRPWRVTELAEQLPEPLQSMLLPRRDTLQQVCVELRTRTEVSRRASQRLLLHMAGVVHSVCDLITDPGTYQRPGHRKHRDDLQRASLVPAGLNVTA